MSRSASIQVEGKPKSKDKENGKGPCPFLCNMVHSNVPDPGKAQTILHPRKDVFILKVTTIIIHTFYLFWVLMSEYAKLNFWLVPNVLIRIWIYLRGNGMCEVVCTLDACLVEVKDLGVSSDQVSILPLGFFLKRTNAGRYLLRLHHITHATAVALANSQSCCS